MEQPVLTLDDSQCILYAGQLNQVVKYWNEKLYITSRYTRWGEITSVCDLYEI